MRQDAPVEFMDSDRRVGQAAQCRQTAEVVDMGVGDNDPTQIGPGQTFIPIGTQCGEGGAQVGITVA
jgi:hypothetical protein